MAHARAGVADHVHAHLALDDARAEALVHQMATGLFAALRVLVRADSVPLAGLAGAAVDAELPKLLHSVRLGVIVARLHQLRDFSLMTQMPSPEDPRFCMMTRG